MRPAALLTDFGLADPYAGQMRAALVRLAPGVVTLDVSHMVEPFAVDQAALFLAASAPHFPADAVFVCVVDPGVGTARRIVGAHVPAAEDAGTGQDFLAPDNGLLGLILAGPDGPRARVYDLAPAAAAYASAATFQGRDVFAPLAARLCRGERLENLGIPVPASGLVRPAWAEAEPGPDGIDARVLHVDRYGDCLLNLRPGAAPRRPIAALLLPGGRRRPLRRVRTYADLRPGEAGILAGSQGFLELAFDRAGAAAALGLHRGDGLRVLWGAEA